MNGARKAPAVLVDDLANSQNLIHSTDSEEELKYNWHRMHCMYKSYLSVYKLKLSVYFKGQDFISNIIICV